MSVTKVVKKLVIEKRVPAVVAEPETPNLSWGIVKIRAYLVEEKPDFSQCAGRLGMTKVNFPACCAYFVVYALGNLGNENRAGMFSKHILQALMCYYLLDAPPNPYAFMTTSDKQVGAIEVLKAIGMKAVDTRRNPNSRNEVTTWISPLLRP